MGGGERGVVNTEGGARRLAPGTHLHLFCMAPPRGRSPQLHGDGEQIDFPFAFTCGGGGGGLPREEQTGAHHGEVGSEVYIITRLPADDSRRLSNHLQHSWARIIPVFVEGKSKSKQS